MTRRGEAAIDATHALQCAQRRAGRAALAIKGGRIQDVWKRKGDKRVTKNSRGLLIQPFAGKVHGTMLKDDLEDPYVAPVSRYQFGAVKRRGSDLASTMAALFADCMRSTGKNFALLFVDLTAAFDTVVRELIMADDTVKESDIRRVGEAHQLLVIPREPGSEATEGVGGPGKDRVAEAVGGCQGLLDVSHDEAGRHSLPHLGDPLGKKLPVLGLDD